MKIALFIVGGVLILFGLIWTLQGLNVLPGSVMSGHKKWVAIGGGLFVVGIILEIVGARFKKK